MAGETKMEDSTIGKGSAEGRSGPLAAVVLAAGESGRMGDFKPMLPLGDEPVVARAAALFRAAGVSDIRVVVGRRGPEMAPVLRDIGVFAVENPDPGRGMFSSVVTGLEALPDGCRAVFVLPVDVPLVRPHTIARLADAWRRGRGRVLYPRFRSRRGHPPLIDVGLVPEIRRWRGSGGLRGALAQREEEAADVETADSGIHTNMNTPAAYRAVVSRHRHRHAPDPYECRAVLCNIHPVEKETYAHCRAVARLTVRFGAALAKAGVPLDMKALYAAGMLHDIARRESRHAERGAEMLRRLGFDAVAEIVETHMDLPVQGEGPPTEAEVLYLADKRIQGRRLVSLDERFAGKKTRLRGDPAARRALLDRLEAARRIEEKMHRVLQRPVDAMLDHRAGGLQ
jgi:putative nucleotidyltransferase with HDIG domain